MTPETLKECKANLEVKFYAKLKKYDELLKTSEAFKIPDEDQGLFRWESVQLWGYKNMPVSEFKDATVAIMNKIEELSVTVNPQHIKITLRSDGYLYFQYPSLPKWDSCPWYFNEYCYYPYLRSKLKIKGRAKPSVSSNIEKYLKLFMDGKISWEALQEVVSFRF